jgi:hypothetical protein
MAYDIRHEQIPSERALSNWGITNHNVGPPTKWDRKSQFVPVNNGDQEVQALMLSTELSINIQRAVCLGRDHRLRLVEVKAAKRKLDLEKVDTLALIETREFCAGLKRRAIEHQGEPTEQQAEDLKELTSSISRGRIDVDTIEKEYEQLDIDVTSLPACWDTLRAGTRTSFSHPNSPPL